MMRRRLTSRKQRRADQPAWLLSVLAHMALIVCLGLAPSALPRGAAEQPLRTVGIVLKHSFQDGEAYEGVEDQADQHSGDTTATQVADNVPLSALPGPDSIPDPSAALPAQTALIGPGALAEGGSGAASQLTRGGGGQPTGIRGGKARVGVFGVVGEGRKFVYVFDRSTSMQQGGRLAAAKRELVRSLAVLESTHQFQIVFFNHDRRVFDLSGGQRRIPFATARAKRLAAGFVGSITAAGSTNRFDALNLAVGMRPDVVFFLTDDDNPMAAGELERIRIKNRGICSINTIEFGHGPAAGGENFLVRLARQNGGKSIYVSTSDLPVN